MPETMNWDRATDETISHLVRLVQAETVNPPGNELPAIMIIKEILDGVGFPQENYQIVESDPNRVNLVARLKGDGSERPFLLSGHVDVVPVEQDKWNHAPFGGEVSDGMVWGRGALDMKGFLAMYLQVFLGLFRLKVPLKRDIILAAIADEEAGFTHGSKFLVEQHRDLIDAEYGITESGGLSIFFGKTKVYPIQVAEKAVCWLRARALGKPGHGSIPHSDNPVFYLAQALEKLRRADHLPVHLSPTFLNMVDTAGSQMNSPVKSLARLLHSPGMVNFILRRTKGESHNMLRALVTNTVSPTMLHSGSKVNVIPSTAEVEIDCRLVPGQTPESVGAEIHRIVGEKIELDTVYTTSGAEFPTDSALFKLMASKTHAMDPGGIVIPMLMPGATDACQYKEAGIKMYGFTPGIVPAGLPLMQLAHGHDERLPISFIASGLPVLWDVLTEFCGRAG